MRGRDRIAERMRVLVIPRACLQIRLRSDDRIFDARVLRSRVIRNCRIGSCGHAGRTPRIIRPVGGRGVRCSGKTRRSQFVSRICSTCSARSEARGRRGRVCSRRVIIAAVSTVIRDPPTDPPRARIAVRSHCQLSDADPDQDEWDRIGLGIARQLVDMPTSVALKVSDPPLHERVGAQPGFEVVDGSGKVRAGSLDVPFGFAGGLLIVIVVSHCLAPLSSTDGR